MHWTGLITYWLLCILCLSALGYYGYAIYAALEFLSHSLPRDPHFRPPLTILKPLCRLDRAAYHNLASFCRQDYPAYQLIFGVRDERDPGVAVVQRIMSDFPALDVGPDIAKLSPGAK